MNKFSPESIAKLAVSENKYYVYRLLDPRTDKTFYVGKGSGNRVFDHVRDARKLISKKEDSYSLKIEIIKEIIDDGKDVICLIHRWGLTENEAYEVEAALIDAYPGLANDQSGHGADYGVISVEAFEAEAKAVIYDEPEENYIIIKTSNAAKLERGSLYEATRKWWRANIEKAQKIPYVLSVINGRVEEVFEPDPEKWLQKDDRISFEGKATQNSHMRALIGCRIPEKYRVKGASNPFLYKKE